MAGFSIFDLSDIASEAQLHFQEQYQDIDPIIGINRGMRDRGFPADLMLIDCPKSKKRITFLLNDNEPHTVGYQFGLTDQDPSNNFDKISLDEISASTITTLMINYLTKSQ